MGPLDRRGLGWRIVAAAGSVIVLQGLYLVSYNLAKESLPGLILMYLLVFAPLFASLYLLSSQSENTRRAIRRKWRRMMA